jgi:FAD/FMN-containing dehydrogenase
VTAGDYTHATGSHGLATGLGDTPTVGVGGITLSGGIGFLVRKNGLTVDNLLAAEVVTAEGEVLAADEETHADLFWAVAAATSGSRPGSSSSSTRSPR